jgi:hypothetical protein
MGSTISRVRWRIEVVRAKVWRPLFADLIFNEAGEPVQLGNVGQVPHYVIPDDDFMRHVEAAYVDRQVVTLLKQRFLSMREVITEGVLQMLGQEDLFTRASIDHALDNLDTILASGQVDVDDLRTTLWMLKFRVYVDVHGDVVRLDIPGWPSEED